jgi:hypothetical protein
MFATKDRVLPVSFEVAASRLEELARRRLLDDVSERAYHDSVEFLLRVGPVDAMSCASRLVRVRLARPVRRGGEIDVAMGWEAVGATGVLFPALDADILLTSEGELESRVALTGSYRPPFGVLGEQLDRFLLHAVATATISAVLVKIAAVLEGVSPGWPSPTCPPASRAGPDPGDGIPQVADRTFVSWSADQWP